MLSREYVLAWLDRTVRKMGKGCEFWTERGKEVSAKSVANMIGCHPTMLRYLARGKRNLSVPMHRRLSGAIESIESGEIKFSEYKPCGNRTKRRVAVKVENPRPRMTLHVNVGAEAKLSIAPPVARPEKMPTFKDAFKRK